MLLREMSRHFIADANQSLVDLLPRLQMLDFSHVSLSSINILLSLLILLLDSIRFEIRVFGILVLLILPFFYLKYYYNKYTMTYIIKELHRLQMYILLINCYFSF